jgi:hypothetical protein
MKSLLIICLTLFSFDLMASTPKTDIPVKKRKVMPMDNIFTFYSVSMQSAEYEVAQYIECSKLKLAIDLKLDGDQSENVGYNCFILKMDSKEFETTEYNK